MPSGMVPVTQVMLITLLGLGLLPRSDPGVHRGSQAQRRSRAWPRARGAVRAFVGGHPPAQVVRDAGGAATAYDVTGLPDSYLVGPDGRVRARFAGAQDWRSDEIGRALDDLMRE